MWKDYVVFVSARRYDLKLWSTVLMWLNLSVIFSTFSSLYFIFNSMPSASVMFSWALRVPERAARVWGCARPSFTGDERVPRRVHSVSARDRDRHGTGPEQERAGAIRSAVLCVLICLFSWVWSGNTRGTNVSESLVPWLWATFCELWCGQRWCGQIWRFGRCFALICSHWCEFVSLLIGSKCQTGTEGHGI